MKKSYAIHYCFPPMVFSAVLFSISLHGAGVKVPDAVSASVVKDKAYEQYAIRMQAILGLHMTSVPLDASGFNYFRGQSYLDYVKSLKAVEEKKSLNNIQNEVVGVFKQHTFSATPEELMPEFSYDIQAIKDLDVVAGSGVNVQKSVNAALTSLTKQAPEHLSCLGKVSMALMLGTPVYSSDLLRARQNVIRELMSESQGALYDSLADCFKDLVFQERYLVPLLVDNSVCKNTLNNSQALLWLIPGLKKMRDVPLIKTVDSWYDTFCTISALGGMAFACYKLFMYGIHAAHRQKTGCDVDGAFGLPEKAGEELAYNGGSYYMPIDLKYFFKHAFGNPNVQAGLALASVIGIGINLKNNLNWRLGQRYYEQYAWETLTRAVHGFSAMTKIYMTIKESPLFRKLPDCRGIYDFFEHKAVEDPELKELIELFDHWTLHWQKGSSFFAGYSDRARELLAKKGREFAALAVSIGRVNVYFYCAQLMKEHGSNGAGNKFCFPTYAAADEKAVFKARELWNPVLPIDKAVPCTIELGGASQRRVYCLNGPNAAGKSTFLKEAALGVLMGQTIGIVAAEECCMSVFSVIETYLNIADDTQEGHSLFKKEVMRVSELLDRAKKAEGKPVFLIFDEMFSGTNPQEGVSAAAAVITYLARMPNVLGCVSTHYYYLTRLSEKYPSVANKCVRLDFDRVQKRFIRNYKLFDGVSSQHVALDMLAEEGVDNAIMIEARDVLRDIEENGMGA